jgi:FkbM family methyltransferase
MDERSQPNFGYTHHDMVDYMSKQGYAAFVAEWSPITEYGRKGQTSSSYHQFLRCASYPLDHQPAWGNLIFVPQAQTVRFEHVLAAYLKSLEQPRLQSQNRGQFQRLYQVLRIMRQKFYGLELGLVLSAILFLYSLSKWPGYQLTSFLTLIPFFFAWRRRMINRFIAQQTAFETRIVNLIDVGSAGTLPYPWRQNTDKILHLLKFEPRDNSKEKNPYIVSVDVALWSTNCERDFYIYKGHGGQGSSLFQQNYEYVQENFEKIRNRGPEDLANTWFERSQLDRVEQIRCRRLDDLLEELDHPFQYHFLKIDAQGAEYEILKGAERFLRESCIGLHLELFTLPLYKGIKLLPEVVEYLESYNFELVKKHPAHGSFDSQHDCVFLKKGVKGRIVATIREIYEL